MRKNITHLVLLVRPRLDADVVQLASRASLTWKAWLRSFCRKSLLQGRERGRSENEFSRDANLNARRNFLVTCKHFGLGGLGGLGLAWRAAGGRLLGLFGACGTWSFNWASMACLMSTGNAAAFDIQLRPQSTNQLRDVTNVKILKSGMEVAAVSCSTSTSTRVSATEPLEPQLRRCQ